MPEFFLSHTPRGDVLPFAGGTLSFTRSDELIPAQGIAMFEQDTNETPVLFRVHRAPKKHGSEVTAVFPCEPHSYDGNEMSCYVHVGQHGGCDLGWYNQTRPATEAEYADLKQELESAPYGYRFKVYRRMNRALRDRFMAEVRRLNNRT